MARRACPVCGKDIEADSPFCSPRCRQIDLGNWLGERYRVPGDPVDPEKLPQGTPDDDL